MRQGFPAKSLVVRPELCVIGASPVGLSIVAAAVLMEVSVVLVHDGPRSDGEGALVAAFLRAAASRAHIIENSHAFGFAETSGDREIDFAVLRAQMRRVIDRQASGASLERYRAMGARVIEGAARFTDSETLAVGAEVVRARRFIVAAAARPTPLAIPGLEDVDWFSGDSLAGLDRLPGHLLVVGGGTEGVSLARMFRRLGSRVTLVTGEARLLPGEDAEMTSVVEKSFRRDSIDLRVSTAIASLEKGGDGTILARIADAETPLAATHLLIATERAPALDGLALEAAGVTTTAGGIVVNRRLRSSNARIYAAGGAVGGGPEAEAAQARTAFRNAVLRLPARFDPAVVPRLVHGDPELASVGMSEEEARRQGRRIRILRAPFRDNDHAVAEGMTDGHVKAVVTRGGQILGCSIAGPGAHEAIHLWAYAMAQRRPVGSLAGLSVSGADLSEVTREAAGVFVRQAAQAPWLRRILGFIRRWG